MVAANDTHVRLAFALAAMAALFLAYAALEYLQPAEPSYALLSLAVGVASVLLLRTIGSSRGRSRLRLAPLSWGGAGMLAAATLLLLPILGSHTGFLGWRWLPALVYAPASGIGQELFFRGALLPVLERLMPSRPLTALLVHCVVFVAWHARTFTFLPSWEIAVTVAAVLFAAGFAWGRQVQRDGTIVWAAVQHSLFLVVMSAFAWA